MILNRLPVLVMLSLAGPVAASEHNTADINAPVVITAAKPNAHIGNNLRMVAKIKVPGNASAGPEYYPFNSAWELARNPSSRQRFDDWIKDNEAITYYGTQLTSIMDSMFGALNPFIDLAGMELLFEFADGSHILMKAPTLASARLRFSYVPGSASDADGNPIADAGTTFKGIYAFSSHARQQQFLEKAAEYHSDFRVKHLNDTAQHLRIEITPIN
ncbi:hypothetical protein CWC22_005170 [Pseudoalteromonas rubra]|uniref:Uncharacterized protein n=1 Tax=Pseudoalteromonas rubra TaxID=43658 RepID=A0A7S7YRY7_9GAMM|nr:hypothetical protein [Pseudoalteromonas rubra]QPB82409.1 hypothetical protein CWC22_005170 [Pseudoalteromonas rubra]